MNVKRRSKQHPVEWSPRMNDLQGKNILVTSGPTRADIDAVRYISNRSSGRLGARIATEALIRGARVTLVSGPGAVRPRPGELGPEATGRLRSVAITTVGDLLHALREELKGEYGYDAIVHAMAVLDYEPSRTVLEKVRSNRRSWSLELKKTPKVISRLKRWSPESFLIGFKLESGDSESELIAAALNLMRESGADFVVANDLKQIRNGAHPALLIDANGRIAGRPQTKDGIARMLCKVIATG